MKTTNPVQNSQFNVAPLAKASSSAKPVKSQAKNTPSINTRIHTSVVHNGD